MDAFALAGPCLAFYLLALLWCVCVILLVRCLSAHCVRVFLFLPCLFEYFFLALLAFLLVCLFLGRFIACSPSI